MLMVACHLPWSIWICKGQTGEFSGDVIGTTREASFKSLWVALIIFLKGQSFFIYYLCAGVGVAGILQVKKNVTVLPTAF